MRMIDNINFDWLFRKGEHLAVENELDWRSVDIPHTWNAFDGQDGDGDYYRGKGTYTTILQKPEAPKGYRHFLEFEGVNATAKVYVDGVMLAEHRGGYSRFRVDVTECFEKSEHIELFVVVDNGRMTDVYPQSADFTFYGGIYRDVNLLSVPETHIDVEYYAGPGIMVESKIDGSNATVNAKAFIKNAEERDRVKFSLYNEDDILVTEVYEQAADVTETSLLVEDAHLWNGVKDPYLYTLEVAIVRNNEVLDDTECSVGIREFSVDPDKGFFLNGVATPLRGVSRHQDKLGIGNALTTEDHYQDAEIIYELGANTVRLAHYQHNQDFYDACDDYGFVVWAEIPFISIMEMDPNAHQNSREQMKELIIQNYNHPSIMFWGISNEITIGGNRPGLNDNLRDLNNLVHEMDKTRLTTMAQVSMLPKEDEQNDITDVLSYNHYFGWYGGDMTMNEKWFDEFHAMWPNRPFGISEYGCEGIVSWHNDDPKCKDYSEEYQTLYHEHMARIIDERPYLWATHVWNMFDFGCDARDEGGVKGRNNKGLVTFDRKIYKDSFYVYKAYWSDDPFVHIAGRRYADRPYDRMDVKVFSNQKRITLHVNGKEFATLEGDKTFIFKDVPLQAGKNSIVAVADDTELDEVIFNRVEKANPGYVKPAEDESEMEGVKNWFTDIQEDDVAPEFTWNEEYFSIKDMLGDICANDEAFKLLAGYIFKNSGMVAKKSMLMIMGNIPVCEKMGMINGVCDSPENERKLKFFNAELQKIRK